MDEKTFFDRSDDIVSRTHNLTWNVMIDEYDELWNEVKINFGGSAEHLKEAQRRICEMKIRFFPKNGPREVFDALWRQMLELGFSDLDMQAAMAFFRANYLCSQKHEIDEEFEVATKMIRNVMEAYKIDNKNEQYEFHAGVLNLLRQRREMAKKIHRGK